MSRDESIQKLSENYLELYRYAFAMLNSKADAEDVVQDALTATLSNPLVVDKYAFCIRVLKRRCLDKLRHKNRLVSLFEMADQPDGQENERIQRLQAVVQELSPKEQEILTLHDVEEVSIREVAERLSLTQANVKKILVVAHKKIRKKLS